MEQQEFKPQCIKQSDLYREIARVIDMCNSHRISTFNSWRFNGEFYSESVMSASRRVIEEHEFSVGVIEGKPVFRGETVYLRESGAKRKIINLDTGWENTGLSLVDEQGRATSAPARDLSLTPPKPKTCTITDAPIPAMAILTTTDFDSWCVTLRFATAKDAQAFYDKVGDSCNSH